MWQPVYVKSNVRMTVVPCCPKVTHSLCPKSFAEPKMLTCLGRNRPRNRPQKMNTPKSFPTNPPKPCERCSNNSAKTLKPRETRTLVATIADQLCCSLHHLGHNVSKSELCVWLPLDGGLCRRWSDGLWGSHDCNVLHLVGLSWL